MDNTVLHISSKYINKNTYKSTNFTYNLPYEIKDIIYIRLSSIEIPNVSYYFNSTVNKNTTFQIIYNNKTHNITIEDGNYSSSQLSCAINNELDLLEIDTKISFVINPITGKCSFYSDNDETFNLVFITNGYEPLNKILGFNNAMYKNNNEYISEDIMNITGSNLFFVKINDYGKITTNFSNNIFAKIITYTDKYTVTFNDGSNLISKDRFFDQPININKLEIQILDEYGNVMDIGKIDISLTLEICTIRNAYIKTFLNANQFRNHSYEEFVKNMDQIKFKSMLNA
jgi:hypothetical protein